MRIIKTGDFNFAKKVKNFQKFERDAPVILGNEARNHFLQGFRRGGGMTDDSRAGWKRRKGGNDGRATLVRSGAMKNDIRILLKKARKVVIGTKNVLYSIFHNDGVGDMPQREFIGRSRKLNRKSVKTIIRLLKRL